MTSQPGYQTVGISVLTNISRSKGNQTINLAHSMEYNNRNSFKCMFLSCHVRVSE